jgi:hypothetical protein
MSKNKCLAVLSSIAIGGLIAAVITTSVSAKVTSYIVNNNGQVIKFNLDDLLAAYTNKLSGSSAPMFDEYMKHSSQLTAFEDDVKGLVSYDSVMKAYKDMLLQNKGNEFNIDTITENASAGDIKNITVGYEWKDGAIVPIFADNSVSQISSINLNQFEITFNTNVDENTAELTSNYKVAGTQLTDSNAHVELINDNTVRVTLVRDEFNNISQGDEKTVSVKKGILTEDKTQTIEAYDKNIEFKDITAPTIKSVSVSGNNKFVIEFSEAVNMSNLSSVASLIEIDGKSLIYNSSYSGPKEAASNGTEVWANKVQFYLNSGLDTGEHAVKVKDADNDMLLDAAGFAFKETDKTFTVGNVSTEPEVASITCTDDGEIDIKFDRPMDTETAINSNYYQINDQKINGAKFELKEDDTVVKITNIPDGILDDGTNVLSMTSEIKDAYGNKMHDDTRMSFDKETDETKPTVLSATITDSTTLRVQFSEAVKYAYATNIDNYELKDASDVELMNKNGVYIEASSDVAEADKADTDIYDIKLDKTPKTSTSTYTFDSSKYTLNVSDIIDTSADPNKMDDQVIAIDGSDDISSLNVEALLKSNTEVALNFGIEMDSSSIADRLNYFYFNGDGDAENLPENVGITVSADNKSVAIDFADANKTINPSATSGTDVVKKIGVKSVKDASGNEFYPGALTIASTSTSGPKLEENTFKLYKDGDDVKAEFQLDNALDTVNVADFKISGIATDDADFDGDKVTLTFEKGDKADEVLALGSSAVLQINPSSIDPSVDIAGRTIAAATEKVYYNNIAPETDRDNYKATVTVDGSGNVTAAQVYVTLKTPVDTDILGAYKDDFLFTNATKGTSLYVESVKLVTSGSEPTLVYTIKDAITKVAIGDKIDITANSDSDDIDLRSQEDGDGNNTRFVPTSDDLIVKIVKVTEVNK